MKRLIYLLPICLLLGLMSCAKENSTKENEGFSYQPLDSLLIGDWKALEIELEYSSVANIPDSNLLVDMLADTSFKASHIVTYHDNDTYSLLFDGSEEPMMGVWNVIGDTALVRMEDNAIYEYSIVRESKDIVYLESIEDLDGDQEADDVYRARYQKIK